MYGWFLEIWLTPKNRLAYRIFQNLNQSGLDLSGPLIASCHAVTNSNGRQILNFSCRIPYYNTVPERETFCDYRARPHGGSIAQYYPRQYRCAHANPAVIPDVDIFGWQMVRRVRGIVIYSYYSHIRGDKTPLANVDMWRILDVDARGPDMLPVLAIDFRPMQPLANSGIDRDIHRFIHSGFFCQSTSCSFGKMKM